MRVAYLPPPVEPAVFFACRTRNEERYWLIAGASFDAFPEWFGEKMSYKLHYGSFLIVEESALGPSEIIAPTTG